MTCITFTQWWFRQVRRANWTVPMRVAILNPLPNAQTYPLPSFTIEVNDKVNP